MTGLLEPKALRMHLGESGGYVIEDKQAGCPWGPKAREKEAAETQLEFNNIRLVLGGLELIQKWIEVQQLFKV